jgi:hypothetical protein
MCDELSLIGHLAFEGFEFLKFLEVAIGLAELVLARAEQGLAGADVACGEDDPKAEGGEDHDAAPGFENEESALAAKGWIPIG